LGVAVYFDYFFEVKVKNRTGNILKK